MPHRRANASDMLCRVLYIFCEMVYTTSEKNGKVRLPKKIKITDNSDADESVFYSI